MGAIELMAAATAHTESLNYQLTSLHRATPAPLGNACVVGPGIVTLTSAMLPATIITFSATVRHGP
jgi:hypothetical protein